MSANETAMITFQRVTQFMFIPSSVFVLVLNYVALKASPKIMKKYKYVIVCTSLSVYQFDFVDSILLCPVNLFRTIGMQYHGILGQLLPRDGFYLMSLYITSMVIMGLSIVASFVWREYALLPFERKPQNIVLLVLQTTTTLALLSLIYPLFKRVEITYEEYRAFRIVYRNEIFGEQLAVFCVIDSKVPAFCQFALLCLGTALYILAIFAVKAVYRIWKGLNHSWLSQTTIRVHKMLLRALIIQAVTPVLIFAAPLFLGVCIGIANNTFKFFPMTQVDQPAAQLGAILITIPSFFSVTHVFTVIYFTTPYKDYLRKMFGIQIINIKKAIDAIPSSIT